MKLYRKELIDFENQWTKEHHNVDDNPKEYLSFLDGLTNIISNHDYELDDRFVTYGRRDFLRKEFTDYLNENLYSGRGKYNDAYNDLADYYTGNTWIPIGSIPDDKNIHSIIDKDTEYKNEGIICKQEIDIINEMIEEFRNFLEK